TWDEPEVLNNVKRVSPWQVEYVVPTTPLHSTLPPAKKFRISPSTMLQIDGEGDLFFPGLSNSMGNLNPSWMNYNSFPAGMQGARQDQFCVSSLSNFVRENDYQMCNDQFFGNKTIPNLETMSTELKNGSSQSENLSPDSQSSVHLSDNELVGKHGSNSSTKVSLGSFQLFSKIIHTKDAVESGCDDGCFIEGNGSSVLKEAEAEENLLDSSLTCPYKELLDGLDVQCESDSDGEASL
ncbi:Arf17p, partial [Sarracenia purpurea var. burkii]